MLDAIRVSVELASAAPRTTVERVMPRLTVWQALASALTIIVVLQQPAKADENGISFWLPGQFGSLSAAPPQPGWSLATVYYHTQVNGGADVARSREITIGRFNPNVNLSADIDLKARADLMLAVPSYTFATPVLDGRLTVGMAAIYGRNDTTLSGTIAAGVGPFTATRSGSLNDARDVFGDLYPQAALRWNNGVHNFMLYSMADAPVGAYDSSRLSNLGIGHWAIDGGGGYTYFDPKAGYEFSAVAGLTYNFKNPSTQYQNGVDLHVDWAASKWLSRELFVGGVGYLYQQASDDIGAPASTNGFKSRVAAIGPQVGYVLPLGAYQGVINLKGYWEFDSAYRASGWNTWLAIAITPREAEEDAAGAHRNPLISK
jgi:hypothetical protein